MKTTKKRLLLSIAGAAMLCTGAVFTTLAATAEAPITDETMLANIEALSREESSGGSADCADYGYKKWYSENNGSLRQEFKDCWCAEKSGYSPTACK